MNERDEVRQEILVEEVGVFMGNLLLAGMKRQRVLRMGYEYACDLYPTNGEVDWRGVCQLGARTVLEAAKVLEIDMESVEEEREKTSRV